MKRSLPSKGRAKPTGITASRKDPHKVRVFDVFHATSPDTSTTDLTYFLWRHILRQPGRVIWTSIYDLLLHGNLPGCEEFVNRFFVAPPVRKPETKFEASKHDKLEKLLSDHQCCPMRFGTNVSKCILLGASERIAHTGAPFSENQKLSPLSSELIWTPSGSTSADANLSLSSSITDDTKRSSEEEIEKANCSSSVAAGTLPPVLPPSVEEAYKKKCIELKRRLTEVEESNDTFRLRKVRLNRAIRKMRLERALLLENLGKRMRKNGSRINGGFDEDSEGSSDQPPTPVERPLRIKRPHRRPASPPALVTQLSLPRMPSNPQPAIYPNSSPHPLAPHPQPQPYLSALPSNGTPTVALHVQAQLNPLAAPQYPPTAMLHPRADPPPTSNHNPSLPPQHPPYPFTEFMETVWILRPQDHPECRTIEQLRDGAFHHWRDLSQRGLTGEWDTQYNRSMQQYEYERDAWKKRNRQEMRGRSGSGIEEGEGEGEGNVSAGGSGVGGGGFTAVNQ